MGLESLLARLEGRPVTPVTAGYVVDVTENPLQNEHVTPVTAVSQNSNLDSASEPGDGGFGFGHRGPIQIHVTDVTDVQARRNAGSACDVTKKPDVTAVTEPAVVGGIALPGVSPKFAARLSAEGLDDIATGARSNRPPSPGRPRTSGSSSRSAPSSWSSTPVCRGPMPSLRPRGSRRPLPGTAVTCGHPYGWHSRATPSCSLRCPKRPAPWMPYPLACPSSPCSRTSVWCGRGRSAGSRR
jgi:hypothetical protein